MSARKEIWVFAESSHDGQLMSVYQELLCKASELSKLMSDYTVCSIVLGDDTEQTVRQVEKSGTSKIYVATHEKLKNYDSENFACVFEALIEKYSPEMILIGATALGSELAPTIAAKVKTGLAAHCVDIKVEGNRVNNIVPAFGGRVLSEIYIPDARPMMASIRPGILESCELPLKDYVELVKADVSCLDEFISREVLVDFIPNVISGKQLEKSDVVVGAGRGVSSEEAWEHLQQFAEKLDAPIGYTRNLVDTGRVKDESNMIGTSGKTVKPNVFIGFGISGAAHYVCGMNKSKLIININKDENAKIFQFSDYGVVGDANVILKALLERLSV